MPPLSDYAMFADLFKGRTDALGLGRGQVVKRPVTLADYERHLSAADDGIGIFPMLDGDECWFAAIDLDEPDFELAQRMDDFLPGQTFIERSRSGNAHVWVFFQRPCPAWAIRAVLRSVTEGLGRPDVELFPKQDRLREGMVGNYINLPFHGEGRPILDPSFRVPDRVLALEDFLVAAEQARQDPFGWITRASAMGARPPEDRETAEWGEAPFLHSCGEHIIEGALSGERPILPGARHQVMFHLAKQLLNYRDMTAPEAGAILNDVNASMPKPLPTNEVDRLYRNAINGRFTSTGCDDPVMAPYILPDCPNAS